MGGKERRDPWESVGISGKDHLTREEGDGNVVEPVTDEEREEWQERLRAAVAATLRARAAKREERADHLRRRRYGKAALHAIKLHHLHKETP